MKSILSQKRSVILPVVAVLTILSSYYLVTDDEVQGFMRGFGYALFFVSIVSTTVRFFRNRTS
jgi:hypothetical protein